MKRRWAIAGVATLVIASAGAVAAREVLSPLRQVYALMHQDPEMTMPMPTNGAVSGITSRLDGVYGFDASAGMYWRMLGQASVRVVPLQPGLNGAGGQTQQWDADKAQDLRSRISPEAFTQLMGLNPVADPTLPPELTVRDQGSARHYRGFGDFIVAGRWRFEVRPSR